MIARIHQSCAAIDEYAFKIGVKNLTEVFSDTDKGNQGHEGYSHKLVSGYDHELGRKIDKLVGAPVLNSETGVETTRSAFRMLGY